MSRKQNQKLTLFYKMAHNLTPHYLTSLIPSTVNETSETQMILGLCAQEHVSTSTLSYLQLLDNGTIFQKSKETHQLSPLSNTNLISPILSYQNTTTLESDKQKYYTIVYELNVALLIMPYFPKI